jgi:hypothetical protein
MLIQGIFLRQKAIERAKQYLPAVIKKQYLTIYLKNTESA